MFRKNPDEVYIIAEIGQNHNGDINICKKLIDQLIVYSYDEITGDRLNTINAIKLTKRDMTEELTDEQMNRPYIQNTLSVKPMGNIESLLNYLMKTIVKYLIMFVVKELILLIHCVHLNV